MYIFTGKITAATIHGSHRPAFKIYQQLLDEYHAKQAELQAERDKRRKEAIAATAKNYHRNAGPSIADRISALAKQYVAQGLPYWKVHEKGTVDVMDRDSK